MAKHIGIISYCDHLRTLAHVNHQFYADQHQNYTYIFDISPTHHAAFKNKIEKIAKLLPLFDYVFWIDDDAFFLQYDQPLEQFISKKHDLTFCASPINNGAWTYLSAGNFFLKNTRRVKDFLEDCLSLELETAKASWKSDEYGLFTKGDQDIMVHLLHNNKKYTKNFHTTLPYELFNTRPFHFKEQPDEFFLVHFTGKDKNQQVLQFADRFSLSDALVPKHILDDYAGIYYPSDLSSVSEAV